MDPLFAWTLLTTPQYISSIPNQNAIVIPSYTNLLFTVPTTTPLLCLSLLHNANPKKYSGTGWPIACDADTFNDSFISDSCIPRSRQLLSRTISSVLHYVIKLNKTLHIGGHTSIFDCKLANPSIISIQAYVDRVMKFGGMTDEAFVMSLIYLDKFFVSRPTLCLTERNVHRLWFMAVMTAAKFIEDHVFDNRFYAKIAGISVKELFDLELEFLFGGVAFALNVPEDVFENYKYCIVPEAFESGLIETINNNMYSYGPNYQFNLVEAAYSLTSGIHAKYFIILDALGVGPGCIKQYNF